MNLGTKEKQRVPFHLAAKPRASFPPPLWLRSAFLRRGVGETPELLPPTPAKRLPFVTLSKKRRLWQPQNLGWGRGLPRSLSFPRSACLWTAETARRDLGTLAGDRLTGGHKPPLAPSGSRGRAARSRRQGHRLGERKNPKPICGGGSCCGGSPEGAAAEAEAAARRGCAGTAGRPGPQGRLSAGARRAGGSTARPRPPRRRYSPPWGGSTAAPRRKAAP